uniref:Uncharacterized protein n=1 Tax=Setaria viridis TaxID=4556 RepID=A0A4U6VYG6_SETVI|nr:hypothetical protein SEVIR_2G010332v2 [Setaria viridis]
MYPLLPYHDPISCRSVAAVPRGARTLCSWARLSSLGAPPCTPRPRHQSLEAPGYRHPPSPAVLCPDITHGSLSCSSPEPPSRSYVPPSSCALGSGRSAMVPRRSLRAPVRSEAEELGPTPPSSRPSTDPAHPSVPSHVRWQEGPKARGGPTDVFGWAMAFGKAVVSCGL